MKDNLFSDYLVSMCMFNIIILIMSAIRMITLSITGSEFVYYTPRICLFTKWITCTLMSISTWHLVMITVCRLLYLIDRTKRLVTATHPIIVIIAFCVVCSAFIIICLHFCVRYTNDSGDTTECYMDETTISAMIIASFYAFMPAFVLLVLNIATFCLYRYKSSSQIEVKSTIRARQQLLFLGFLSSTQFIVTAFPITIYLLNQKLFFDTNTHVGLAKANMVYYITAIILLFNNASNFLIYCFFGRKFRKEFWTTNQFWLRCFCPACVFESIQRRMDEVELEASSSKLTVAQTATDLQLAPYREKNVSGASTKVSGETCVDHPSLYDGNDLTGPESDVDCFVPLSTDEPPIPTEDTKSVEQIPTPEKRVSMSVGQPGQKQRRSIFKFRFSFSDRRKQSGVGETPLRSKLSKIANGLVEETNSNQEGSGSKNSSIRSNNSQKSTTPSKLPTQELTNAEQVQAKDKVPSDRSTIF
ncbi:uncharacterized protein LOC131948924 [Physella acuta]|uniref:uncharacterized protein LOC131948924 n=1 Tax=Physella acuta TaxID=109671 RepID=UPI0027DBBAB5|nr:uncharacterized protein LOC131948924 [Physella acuta]